MWKNILEIDGYETHRFLPNLQLAENFKEGENVPFFVSANRIKPDECFSDDINKTGFCSKNTDLIIKAIETLVGHFASV